MLRPVAVWLLGNHSLNSPINFPRDSMDNFVRSPGQTMPTDVSSNVTLTVGRETDCDTTSVEILERLDRLEDNFFRFCAYLG